MLLTSFLTLMLAAPESLPAAEKAVYHIKVSGPLAEFEVDCDDPCQIDEHELVGETGQGVSTEKIRGSHTDNRGIEDRCQVDCKNSTLKGSRMVFKPKRDLRQGVEVSISDGQAHFIFYSVVEKESGPSSRVQHAEFRIDRALIDVSVHDHDIVVRSVME